MGAERTGGRPQHHQLEKAVTSEAGQESPELTGVNAGWRSSGVATNRIKSTETLEWTTEKARQDNASGTHYLEV